MHLLQHLPAGAASTRRGGTADNAQDSVMQNDAP
jgi:hypothetical protein